MNWKEIAEVTADIVMAAEPIIAIAVPGVGPALVIAEKILQGVIAAEPTAVALYKRIVSGEIPSPTELQQYAADYEDSYQKLKASIAKKLAETPA